MRFTIYQDKRGEHRWRALSRNGRIVADSGEGYSSKGNVTKALNKFVETIRMEAVLISDEAAKPQAKKVVAKSVTKKVVAKRATK